ncbi:autotransporter-associated beta strand repeat-containing protein [Verrucomicrobium sp. BvORR034]|uniref:beta strand repeat-containing protein n=1 Tax=Verrucomicrobium sp. BvORR034 TaxID=1396418 RepID=UPI000679014D|nr:autotransporter-associated beta strand repeat-containing protein [Verrucomicrobium sp. BvORR034]
MTSSKLLLLCSALLLGMGPSCLRAATLTWDADTGTSGAQDGGGLNWLDASRWWDGGANVTWSSGNDAVIGSATGAAGVITLGPGISAVSLTFNAPGSGAYTLTGGTLGLTSGNIVANASATIESVLNGTAGLNKSGAGTLTLAGGSANTYAGLTTISEGTVAMGKTSGVAVTGDVSISGTGKLQWNAAGQVATTSNLTMSAGSIDFGGFDVTLASLTKTNGDILSTARGSIIITGTLKVSGGTSNSGTAIGYTVNTAGASTSYTEAGTVDFRGFVGTALQIGSNSTSNVATFAVGTGGLLLDGQTLQMNTTTNASGKGTKILLKGNVTATGVNTILMSGTTNIAGVAHTIDLDGGVRTFDIASGGVLHVNDPNASTALKLIAITNGGITKTGAGTLQFNGTTANTYTGLTTVTAGTLNLNKTANVISIAGNILVNGGTLALMTDNQIADASDLVISSGAVSFGGRNETVNSITMTGGTFSTGNTGGVASLVTVTNGVSIGGGAKLTVNSGGTLSANSLSLAGVDIPVNGAVGGNILVGGSSTTAVTTLTIGAGGLSMTGQTIQFNSATGTNRGSRIELNGDFTGTGTNNIALSGTSSGSAIAELSIGSATRTFNVVSGTTNITGISVVGTGGTLVKTGAGQLALSANNTYTGNTVVKGGTLTLTGTAGRLSATSGLQISGGGTLQIGSGTAASNNGVTDRVNNTVVATLGGADGGGRLILAAAAAGNSHAQTLAGLMVNQGVNAIATNAATGTNTLTFSGASGSVYSRSVGGYVDFANQTGFSVVFTNGPSGAGVAGAGVDAILIGATMNTRKDFVTAQSGVITAATYTATGAATWDAGKNMNVTGDVTTGGADAGINSLRFAEAAARTVTLTGTQTIASGMILVTSDVANNATTITGGTLRGSAGGELMVMQNNTSNTLTISSTIADNGSATALTKVGAGVLILTADNTYTGTTYLLEGVLRATDGLGLAEGNLVLNGGVLESSGSFTRGLGTGVNQVQITGGASGFSARDGALTVNLGGAGATVQWGSSLFNPSSLVLNASTANSTLDFQNGIDLNGGVRTVSVQASTATISGLISNSGTAGAEGLVKTGTGTLVLDRVNTYAGTTTLTAGVLQVGNDLALGTSTLALNGGTLQAINSARSFANSFRITADSTFSGTNSITINGTFVNGSATPILNNNISGAGNVLTLNGNVYLSEDNTTTGRYLQILGSGSTTIINGVIANNSGDNTLATGLFFNVGSGSLRLTADNTYTGRTLLAGGKLIITRDRNLGIGPTSALTDAIIVAAGGTLRAEGTFTLDANRSIGIGGSGGSTSAAPSTGTFEVAAGHTLTIAGVIANRTTNVNGSSTPANFGALTKSDTGRLVLQGNNTYSGLTTVSNGVLELRHGSGLGTTETGTTVGANASLQLAGSITVGAEALTLSGNGLGGGGALRNIEGNNTWGGLVSLGATNTRINSDLGTLTLDVASGDAIANTATTGTRVLSLGGAGDIVVADAINQVGVGGTLSVVKDGMGTVTLSGTNNINGTVTVNSGRLVLDYSTGNFVLPTTKALTFSGGAIEVKAQGGGSVALGDITLVANSGLNKLVVGAGTTLTLGNTWTRNSTSSLLIDLSAAGSVLNSSPTTTEVKTIASSGNTTGTMIVGSAFAAYTVKDGNGRYDFAALSGGSVVRLDASLALPSTGGNVNNAYLLKPTSGSSTLQFNAGATVNTAVVRVDTTEAAGELDLNGGKLVLNDLGFLVDGSNNFTIKDTSVGQTGLLEGTSTNTALFMYHYGTGTLTITAKLSSGGGSIAFIGEGGLVDWNSASNSTGATNIQGAVVRVSHIGALSLNNTSTAGGGTQFINLSNGAILELATGNLTRNLGTSGNGVLGFQAGDGGGFSAFGADRTVNFTSGVNSINIVWGTTTGFLASGSKLILGSKYADKRVDFVNNVDLNGGNQIIDVQSANTAGVGGKLSGVISGATGSLQKIGQGILEVTGNNTYGGGTTVKEGTFLANNALGSATGVGNVTVLSGARLGGNGTVGTSTSSASITVKSGGTLSVGQLGNTSGQQLKLATGAGGVITLSGTVEFDIFGNNGGVNPIGNNDSLGLTSSSPIALGGTLKIVDSTDVATELTLGSSWQLIDWTNVIVSNGQKYTGAFTTFDVPVLAEGLAWDYSQLYTTGYVSITVVPEPGRVMLLAGGLAALLMRRRRRQRA